MGYDMNEKTYSKELDLTKLKPYGDTMNDGKVQLSFTLPIKNDEQGHEAAKDLVLYAKLQPQSAQQGCVPGAAHFFPFKSNSSQSLHICHL